MRSHIVGLMLLLSCTRSNVALQDAAPVGVDTQASSVPVVDADTPTVLADAAAPEAGADLGYILMGLATLTVERVDGHCLVGPGEERTFFVGYDLLVEKVGMGSNKVSKEFAMCPSQSADGGIVKPQLDTWQNCSRFASCKILTLDSGSDRAEVQCGKTRVAIERDGRRTMIRGPFGERELAPYPMRIAPVKQRTRRAEVDC